MYIMVLLYYNLCLARTIMQLVCDQMSSFEISESFLKILIYYNLFHFSCKWSQSDDTTIIWVANIYVTIFEKWHKSP